MNEVLSLNNGFLSCTSIHGEYRANRLGIKALAFEIVQKARGNEILLFCSSTIDHPEEYGGQAGIDYGQMLANSIARQGGKIR